MTIKKMRIQSVELTPENIEGGGGSDFTRDGELGTDSSDNELKVRLNGDTKTVVTEDQTQVLTNKTIDADLNTISDLEVDSLKSGVLNVSTTLSGASDTQLPSALAVKTYVDDKAAAQNEASEISYDPTASGLSATNVQDAIDEVEGVIESHILDTADAHDASAISNSPSGNLAATDVQAALNELQGDIDTANTNIGTANTNLTNHLNDTTDAHDASAISNTTVGIISSTDVQSTIAQIEGYLITNNTNIANHIIDATDAHDASAISNIPSGNLAATDIQGAVNELQSDIDLRALTTNGSIITPTRLDVKQDTKANLTTYATTATNGQIVFATDTKEYFAVTDNTLVSLGGGGISLWVTAKDYVVNNVVIESDKIYRCLIAHTSGTFATDLAASKWVEVSAYANLTGAITSVGATTSLGSFSSSNLSTALTDKTGTGVNVFATSPTLVTPNIGVANGTSLVLGGTINANAILDVQSTTKAVMMPRMTSVQRDAIVSPTAAMEIYNSDLNIKQYYNGSSWVANTSIQLDNVYSTTVSPTGVITNPSKSGWVSSCTNSAGVSTCQFQTGLFTVTPNCTAVVNENSTNVFALNTISTMSVTFQNNTVGTSRAYSLICQKAGANYQSTDAYIASNSNYSRIAYTPTITGLGTVTNLDCLQSRDGEHLEVECSLTTGTVAGSNISVSLPTGLTVASNIADATTGYAIIGQWARGAISSLAMTMIAAPGGSTVFAAIYGGGVRGAITPAFGTDVGSSEAQSFRFRVPISGWTNSNVTVASFAGTPNIPGLTTAVDTFSVSYGTTNATTPCTASPCSYLDQIGTAVTSITRTGTGNYALNTSRTYAKLKCIPGIQSVSSNVISSNMRCENCNTIPFNSVITTVGGGFIDGVGTLLCQGSY